MRKRRQKAVAVLFFPVLSIIFLVGWLLTMCGDSKKNRNKESLRAATKLKEKSSIEENQIEMGLMEQFNEEQITAE